MIKVNSKVIILGLCKTIKFGTSGETKAGLGDIVMVVEGLYYQAVSGRFNIKATTEEVKPDCAKCIWYNDKRELQSEYIDLELLIEL